MALADYLRGNRCPVCTLDPKFRADVEKAFEDAAKDDKGRPRYGFFADVATWLEKDPTGPQVKTDRRKVEYHFEAHLDR